MAVQTYPLIPESPDIYQARGADIFVAFVAEPAKYSGINFRRCSGSSA